MQNIAELVPINIEEEMKRSYLDYAMSVIISRALPDVRDGLKPVHRRILYAMYQAGNYYNRPFKKSARIVGDVMGKFHPHGDSAIYQSLVRMAQTFSLRATLIDGQGNFGSMDGDAAAAMRYTESRLAKISHFMLDDIEKETVDFYENYDGSEFEPAVLPSKFPNLLVNGAGGIAVGMATNIPSHNLGEIIDACCYLIDNEDDDADEETIFSEILQIVKGPDFPTGATILGRGGINSALRTGRGSIIIRGKAEIEEKDGREAIIISEIPYQVNKAKLVERIAELVKEKRIEGITDLRDESDKSGVRVVVEVRRDAAANVVLNQLYSYSPLQVSFGVNMLALNNGKPETMNLIEILHAFLRFRESVITKRTTYLLTKARDRAHILIGLSIAVHNIDEMIALIKAAKDPVEAKEGLMQKKWKAENVRALIELIDEDNVNELDDKGHCYLTEAQAKAILEMRLQRLTGLEFNKISDELQALAIEIKNFLEILNSRPRLLEVLKEELVEIKDQFATPRLTDIVDSEFENDIEDLIQKEDMVVTLTMGGYIKRVPLSTYRAQKRGGKGRSGLSMKEEDATTDLFVTNTHEFVLFFSNIGKVYRLKVYKLPLGNPQSKGKALVNIFPLAANETITNMMPIPADANLEEMHIIFATAKGNIRRNDLSDFKNIQSNGKIAIRLDEDDSLVGVKVCNDSEHILLASKQGMCVRCPVSAVRVFKSRTSDGVRGMKLAEGDRLISMSILKGREFGSEGRNEFLRIPLEQRLQIAACEDASSVSGIIGDVETTLDHQTIFEMAKDEEFILTITENGYGKRSSAYEYRVTNRGTRGITNIVTSERNGNVIASLPVLAEHEIMLISDQGQLIRCPVHGIRIAGRATQGVVIFRLGKNEVVASVALIADTVDGAGSDEEGETDE